MKRKEVMLLLGSVVGALVFLSVASPSVSHQLAAFRFSLQVSPGLGYTRLELPPIGSVEAKTHLPPFSLVLNLQSIDLNGLQQLLSIPDSKDVLLTTLAAIKWQLLGQLLLRATIVAALGGAWGSSWVRRSWRDLIQGSITGILLVLMVMIITAATYNPQALVNPVYRGALAGAPWVLGLAQNAWHNWNALGSTAKIFVRNLRQVMAQATTQLPLEQIDRDFKILHVSDLHNNPQAIDFILDICDNLAPDIIIDTGDLTDFGTPLEEALFSRLSLLRTPYYLVLGNHDSPAVAESVAKIPGLVLLDGSTKAGSIRMIGSRDPASWTDAIAPSSSEQISIQADLIQSWLQTSNEQPFLLAVHDPRTAQLLVGQIPLILTGHTHINMVESKGGTVLVNAGTTGGAGLRGLLGEKEVPLTASLLYVDTTGSEPTLDAVDVISLYPRENRFELIRTVIP